MKYKIYLGWKDQYGDNIEDWYDDAFKDASLELFQEMVKKTEQMLLEAIKEYGVKEYIHYYSPYTFIRLHCDGKVIASWNIEKFLRKEGYLHDNNYIQRRK